MATLTAIAKAINAINVLVSLIDESSEYRYLIAKAIEENRELTNEELDALELKAINAINRALDD